MRRLSPFLFAGYAATLALAPMASCQVAAPAQTQPARAALPRSLWVWDATVITNPNRGKQLLDFCAQKRIQVIYISLGDVFQSKKRESTNPRHVTVRQLAAFNRMAHAAGLEVEGLDGDPSFALRDKHELTLTRLKQALSFNRMVAPAERLDGWQWDTEPYILAEFKASEASARDILIQYLDSAAQMRDAVKEEPNFKLGYAIPSFFDNANRSVTWQGVNKPAAYHLLDILNTIPNGYVAIMAYREKADGTNGTIAISTGEVEYSRKFAPRTRVWIGQETGQVKGDPPTITFWEEGEAAMETELSKINASFAPEPVVGGIAIHHWASYVEVSSRDTLTIASPGEGQAVPRMAKITGTAPVSAVGGKVVVSVRPDGDEWYRQGEAAVGADGRWEVTCRFGNEKTPAGRKFQVCAQLLSAAGATLAELQRSTQTQ